MLTDVDYYSLEYIALHLRPGDKEEVFGLMNHDDPLRLAYEVNYAVRNMGRGRIGWHNGRPASLVAFIELRSGVWETYAFGTDDFKSTAFEIMKWLRSEANQILTVCKGHRLQCVARADYEEGHKFIRAMGGKPEGPILKAYGKDGKDYQMFTWHPKVNDAILRPNYVPEKEKV